MAAIRNEADVLEDARRARRGEDPGAGDRQRGRRLATSAPGAFAAPQRGLRRGRSFLAGQARDSTALDVEFDRRQRDGDLSTAKIDAMLAARIRVPNAASLRWSRRADARSCGSAPASIIERRFMLPHIAHAPLEPVNATASYQDGAVEIWGPDPVGHGLPGGGRASGRLRRRRRESKRHLSGRQLRPQDRARLSWCRPVQVSKAVGRPVKLIRSREEDMQHDVYRPNAGGRFRAVLDDAGYPLAIHARVAGQSLFGATRKSWLDQTPEGAWDESMVDGIYNQSYRLPHFLVETVDTPLPIPVYFMRSVGSTAAVFFWESFITELAQRARGSTSIAYRRNLLADDPLALRVLDAAAQASGWEQRHAARYVPRHRRTIAISAAAGGSRLMSRKWWSCGASTTGSPSSACSARSIRASWSTPTRSRRRSRAASASRSPTRSRAGSPSPTAAPIRATSSTIRCCASTRCRRSCRSCLPSDRPPQGFGEVVLAPGRPAVAQALLHATGRRLDVMPFPEDAFRVAAAARGRSGAGKVGGRFRPVARRAAEMR